MLSYLFAALLLLVAIGGVVLKKTYYYLPLKELKRQAEQGDKLAVTLYRSVAYGPSLRVLLWLEIGLGSAGGFVLLARIAPWWLGFVVIALLLWLAFSWLPNTRVTTLGAHLALWSSPAFTFLLGHLHPILSRLGDPLHHHYQSVKHTGIYESDDLLAVLENQQAQEDNRIPKEQLDALERALTAHHYKVSDVLVPGSKVKSVSDNDTIGLVLLDELHASGQSSFPVRQGKTDKIIGTLYLHDLGLKTEGKVRDFMVADVRYLHEDDSLTQALQAFYKTRHQLFVVVNSFEEYVGVVTLEQVIKQLAGEPVQDEFDQHHDLAAVAGKHAHDDEQPAVTDVEAEPDEVSVAEPADEIITEPEPETELVTDELEEVDEQSTVEPEPDMEVTLDEEGELVDEEADDASDEKVPDNVEEDKPEPTNESSVLDADSLAALDLPDEEDNAELGEGSHVTFEKSRKAKSKPANKGDEVV